MTILVFIVVSSYSVLVSRRVQSFRGERFGIGEVSASDDTCLVVRITATSTVLAVRSGLIAGSLARLITQKRVPSYPNHVQI